RFPDLVADRLLDGRQRLGELFGVLAAGLCEVRPASAAAADHRRKALDQLAGFDPRRQVLGHRRHQVDVAVAAAADDHHPRAELAAQRVGHVPHLAGRGRRDLPRDDLDAVDRHLAVRTFPTARAARSPERELQAELLDLLFELALAGRELPGPLELLVPVRRLDPQDGGDALQGVALAADLGEGVGARQGLDPPHSGGDAALRLDEEEPDLAAVAAVAAAAP